MNFCPMENWKTVALVILVLLFGLGAGIGLIYLPLEYVDFDSFFLGKKGGLGFFAIAISINLSCLVLFLAGKKVVEIADGTLNIKHKVYTWPEKVDLKEINWINVGDERVVLTRADDDFFDFYVRGSWKYALAGFVVAVAFLGFVVSHFTSDDEIDVANAVFTPPILAGFVFMLMNAFKELRYSFDRFAGKIHVRVNGLSFSIPFDKVIPFNHWDRMYLKHKYLRFPFRVYGERGAMQWSFYVQYMDKNQTLPPGTAFDAYREKDFQRRKAEGFPEPKYPVDRGTWLCDATVGYIYGTQAFKEKLKKCKINIAGAGNPVNLYIFFDLGDKELVHNNIVLLGFYQDFFVFKYGAPKNQPYVILEEEPNDCFWVHCRSGRLTVKGNAYPKEIKPQKK